MDKLTLVEADNFLNEHFKLFLEKNLEEGFSYHIILISDSAETCSDYFYVKFCNDSGCPKDYKIVCG